MDKLCYIEDINGGYFCNEQDKDYFLNEYEYTKDCGGIVCDIGTKEDLEKRIWKNKFYIY